MREGGMEEGKRRQGERGVKQMEGQRDGSDREKVCV